MQKLSELRQLGQKESLFGLPLTVASTLAGALLGLTMAGCSAQTTESRRHHPGQTDVTREIDGIRAVPANPSGTVTSGGSLIYGDRINPWFTPANSTTTKPTWCINHDATNFGRDLRSATAAIEQALAAWEPVSKVRFQKADSCTKAVDLKFLLGSLSSDDRSILAAAGFANDHSLRELAGVTVQTKPGNSSQKGQGLIYIAPSSGALAIASDEIISTPWSRLDGKLLQVVLLHELGHVFGLQHTTDATGLMGQRTVELMLNRKTIETMEADTSRRQEFEQRYALMQPSTLIQYAQVEEFEKCRDGQCTKVVLTQSNSNNFNRLIIDIWTAPEMARQFWGTSGYTRVNSALLTLEDSRQVPVSMTREDGNELPGILAISANYSGMDEHGQPLTLQRTSGQMPRVIGFDGTKIKLIIE